MIVAPGAVDCITGRAIAHAGFSAVYMTGAGTSATLGYPDYGLITMSEMVGNASRIVNSIDIPLISDSDTGFGNELNVFRTVQEFRACRRRRDPYRGSGVSEEVVAISTTRSWSAARISSPRSAPLRPLASRRTSASSPAPTHELSSASTRRSSGPMPRSANGADVAIRRGAADHGRDRGRAEAGQGTLPAEHRARRARRRRSSSRWQSAWATPSPSSPGLLLGGIIQTCDRLLADLKNGKFPPVSGSPGKTFARFGAAEWDERRTAFRDQIKAGRGVIHLLIPLP